MVKTKWDEKKVIEVIREAREAGKISAENKLSELQGQGPKWNVVDDSSKRVVGQMLDVCGFAHLKISARGKFYLLAKKVSQNRQYRFHCDRDSYCGGGWLSIYDSTNRQEMSVNIAACKGQAEVLKRYNIDSNIDSRID